MKTTSANLEPATSGTPILDKRTPFAMSRLGPYVAAAVILLGGPSALAAITPVASYNFNNHVTPAGATVVGTPTYSNGQLVLNGSSCLSLASPISVTDNFGMEVICTPTFNDSYNYSLTLNNGANNGWGILQLSGAYQGVAEGAANGFFGNAGAGSAVPGVTVRLALVRAGGVTTLYRNGVAVGTTTTISRDIPTKFTIGGNQLNTTPVFEGFFKGSIDEVRVFTFAAGAFNPVTDLSRGIVTTVTTTADEFDTPSGASLSLREAVRDAATAPGPDTITFAPSLNGQTITLTTVLGGEIILDSDVTIDASNLPSGITIDGGAGDNRIFSIPSRQTVTLNRLTLTDGGGTGAILSGFGGAIFANSLLTLNHCSFLDNSAVSGGGVYITSSRTSLTLNHCSFQDNSASGDGGGIFNRSLSTLTNCSFQGNSASGNGGGIYDTNTLSTLLTNCSFQGNSASVNGGGIYVQSVKFTITNCSFQGNSASGNGGGIYETGTIEGAFAVNNCIIWKNKDNSGTGTAASSVFIALPQPSPYSHSLIQGINPSGTGNLNGTLASRNPIFIREVDPNLPVQQRTGGDLRLRGGSPAIDAGDNTQNSTSTDLGGQPRLIDGNQDNTATIDLGAYESESNGERRVFVNAAVTGGNGDGTSWANAFRHLQPALSGMEIWVAQGTYYPDEGTGQADNDRTSTFALKAGAALYGGFEGTETLLSERDPSAHPTILSGDIDQNDTTTGNTNNAYHVLRTASAFDTATTILDGFTITSGNANGDTASIQDSNLGGGLLCKEESTSTTLTNCSFQGNSATSDGGGIYISGPAFSSTILTLTNCSFQGNSAGGDGGGICAIFTSSTLNNCSFQSNSASNSASSSGGGMYNRSGPSTVTNCSFQGNSAGVSGGGIDNRNGPSTLTNCSFQGNSAGVGGGILNFSGLSTTITNCSFQGNSATTNGGGIYNFNPSSTTLNNCIIWNNAQGGDTTAPGASIYNNNSTPTYSYCLIANSGGSTAWVTSLGTDGGNNLDTNPLFVREVDPNLAPIPTGGDLRLLTGSPALNAGDDTKNSTPTDLAGNPRKVGIIDLGAYEGAFVTFAHLGYSDPNGDANANGITNFGDYAAGGNPSAPDDPSLRPTLIGDQLTFSFRDNAADIAKEFQKSTTLLPGSWMEMIETTDYNDYTCSSISSGRSLQTLTLSSGLRTTNPKLFFRQEFRSIPPPSTPPP